MVSARSRTSAPMSAFNHTFRFKTPLSTTRKECFLLFPVAEIQIVLTLASHGHRDVDVYLQFTARGEQVQLGHTDPGGGG